MANRNNSLFDRPIFKHTLLFLEMIIDINLYWYVVIRNNKPWQRITLHLHIRMRKLPQNLINRQFPLFSDRHSQYSEMNEYNSTQITLAKILRQTLFTREQKTVSRIDQQTLVRVLLSSLGWEYIIRKLVNVDIKIDVDVFAFRCYVGLMTDSLRKLYWNYYKRKI